MKRLLLFQLLILIVSTTFAQKGVFFNADVYACVPYNDSTFIKQTEVSIADWLGFVYDEHADGAFVEDEELAATVKAALPELIFESDKYLYEIYLRTWGDNIECEKFVWYRETLGVFPLCLNKAEKKDFDKIKTFLKMPITGLTNQQVKDFLDWQSLKLDDLLKETEAYHHVAQLIPEEFYDTLIMETKKNISIAKNKDGSSATIGDSINTKTCHLFNFKGNLTCPSKNKRLEIYGTIDGPVAVDSYNPDINGLYNLLGNVSEITLEGGVAKGGHYDMYAKDILKNEKLKYSSPSLFIGFRYIVTLVRN